MEYKMIVTTIDEVIKVLGGPTEAARRIGTTPSGVCNWRLKGRIPRSRYLKIYLELRKLNIEAKPSLLGLDGETAQVG
jgi:hypothetical protein